MRDELCKLATRPDAWLVAALIALVVVGGVL